MDLQIRGTDIAVTDGLRDYARARIQKLDRRLEHVVEAKLELKKRHQRSGGNLTAAQLTIQTGRMLLRSEEYDHDPRKAIDLAIDKMDRRIRKAHDRRTDRKGRPPTALAVDGLSELALEVDEDELIAEEETESPIVRTKRFSVKPMDPEEAIEQMELLDHDFYLFLNAEEEQLNVVYRRRDGTYGLLAPDRP